MFIIIGRVKLIVDKKAIAHNISEFKKFLNPSVEMLLVHKGYSYGTDLYKNADFFKENNIVNLGIATTNEAICLREAGFSDRILLLSQPLSEEIPYIVEHDLISSVCYFPFIKELNEHAKAKKKVAKIHIKINTGMNRLGIRPEVVAEMVAQIRELSNIELEGIFTHFSSSDDNNEYTNHQIAEFEKAKNVAGFVKYIHSCNTMGILNFPQAHNNMVRLGTGQYGYLHNPIYYNKIDLKPALMLQTKVSYIFTVAKGEPLAYNHSVITERQTKIAVIPIGYGDGLVCTYKGRVFVNGYYANIIGRISMDLTLIDITDIPNDVQVSDDVYIWDNKNITLEEVGKNSGSILAEIFGHLTQRVEKVYT